MPGNSRQSLAQIIQNATPSTSSDDTPRIVEKPKPKPQKPAEKVNEENPKYAKPEKFISKDHEIKREITDHKRRVIMRVERKDFVDHFEGFDEKMSNETLFKNPVNHEGRITAVKYKIYNATGIEPHKLDIVNFNISSKNATLAWVTFGSEKTVREIFRLSVQNGNETKFNCFPHIPAKGMKRNDGIVKILKRLQLINTNL